MNNGNHIGLPVADTYISVPDHNGVLYTIPVLKVKATFEGYNIYQSVYNKDLIAQKNTRMAIKNNIWGRWTVSEALAVEHADASLRRYKDTKTVMGRVKVMFRNLAKGA